MAPTISTDMLTIASTFARVTTAAFPLEASVQRSIVQNFTVLRCMIRAVMKPREDTGSERQLNVNEPRLTVCADVNMLESVICTTKSDLPLPKPPRGPKTCCNVGNGGPRGQE